MLLMHPSPPDHCSAGRGESSTVYQPTTTTYGLAASQPCNPPCLRSSLHKPPPIHILHPTASPMYTKKTVVP